ncbi:TPA: hypothetical protein ACH3X3_001254 [Trebouxia sp. C0006]
MSRLSAVLYNVMFMQQVQTAGQMAALAAGHHELIVEVVPFGNGLLMCTAPVAPGACTESSLGSGLSTH